MCLRLHETSRGGRGYGDGDLRDLRPRLEEAVRHLLEDPPGFMRLPETNELSEPSKALARRCETRALRNSSTLASAAPLWVPRAHRASTTPTKPCS